MLYNNISPMLNIAIRAVRTGGDLIIKYYNILNTSETLYSKDNANIAMKLNHKIETSMIAIILKSFPYHNVLGKSLIKLVKKNHDVQWIINPLNSTNNFFKSLPHFAVSISVKIKNRTEIAVIYDPIRNELFSASRGCGAQLNGYRLRNRIASNINNIILVTSCLLTQRKYEIDKYIHLFSKIFMKYINIRCTGSVVLDLAYVAASRFDGFFGTGLKIQDFSSGELIIREAGGFITDFHGNDNYLSSGRILAGNAKIIREMLTLINSKIKIH